MVKRKLVKMAEDSSKLVSYYRELNYAELYNELVTEITELPLLFLRLKSACRLVEAEKRNIKSLDDVYSELDTTFQSITVILGELRKKEKDVIYVEGHVIPQTTINNSE